MVGGDEPCEGEDEIEVVVVDGGGGEPEPVVDE